MSGRTFDPLDPPRPPNFGYFPHASQAIPSTQVDLPTPQQPDSPSQVQYDLSQRQQQLQIPMPDIVRVKYAGGDADMVRRVFNIAQGEDPEGNGLYGFTKEDALRQLQDWGYPTDSNTWTADQWTAAIQAKASQPNLLSLLGYQ